MKRRITRTRVAAWLFGIVLGILIGLLVAAPVMAATSQEVTITATPNYVSISNTPATWTLNDAAGGGGLIDTDTVYYSNPLGDTTPPSATVVDGECRFTLTNTSGPDIDIYTHCDDFTGGDANMTNSDDGSNGATSFGAYSWYSGLTYASKVVMKTTTSDILYNEYSGASLKWGMEVETRTNAWTGASSSTANMTIFAIVD